MPILDTISLIVFYLLSGAFIVWLLFYIAINILERYKKYRNKQ